MNPRPCWSHVRTIFHFSAYFSLLGRVLFTYLRFFAACCHFLSLLGHSGVDFEGFGEVPGMAFQAPGPHFLRFFLDCELSMRQSS